MRAGIPRSKKTQLTRPDQRTASFVSGREPRTLQVHGGRDTRGGGGAMRDGKRCIQRRTRAGAASCIIPGDRKATGDDQRGRPCACSNSSSHGRGTLSEAKPVLSQKKLVNFLLPFLHSLSCADCTERERETKRWDTDKKVTKAQKAQKMQATLKEKTHSTAIQFQCFCFKFLQNQEMGHQGKEEETRNNTTQHLFFLFLLFIKHPKNLQTKISLPMWGFLAQIHSTHKE